MDNHSEEERNISTEDILKTLDRFGSKTPSPVEDVGRLIAMDDCNGVRRPKRESFLCQLIRLYGRKKSLANKNSLKNVCWLNKISSSK